MRMKPSASTTISPLAISTSPSVSQTTTSDPNHKTWQRSYYINQGVHPWSYGYNTGIHPYTVTYNYPVTSTVVYPNINQINDNLYNYNNNNNQNLTHENVQLGQFFSTSPQPNQDLNHFSGNQSIYFELFLLSFTDYYCYMNTTN